MIPEIGNAYAVICDRHHSKRHRIIAWDSEGYALIANSSTGRLERAANHAGFRDIGNTIFDTAYRTEHGDTFSAFADECLEGVQGHLVKAGTVYAVYMQWAKANGVGTVPQQRFRKMLEPQFPGLYDKKTGNPSERYYGGLRLREGVTITHPGVAANPVQRPDASPPPEHVAFFSAQQRAEH